MPRATVINRMDGFWWCSWSKRLQASGFGLQASGFRLQASGEARPDAGRLKPTFLLSV
jgi:hypothetical protein